MRLSYGVASLAILVLSLSQDLSATALNVDGFNARTHQPAHSKIANTCRAIVQRIFFTDARGGDLKRLKEMSRAQVENEPLFVKHSSPIDRLEVLVSKYQREAPKSPTEFGLTLQQLSQIANLSEILADHEMTKVDALDDQGLHSFYLKDSKKVTIGDFLTALKVELSKRQDEFRKKLNVRTHNPHRRKLLLAGAIFLGTITLETIWEFPMLYTMWNQADRALGVKHEEGPNSSPLLPSEPSPGKRSELPPAPQNQDATPPDHRAPGHSHLRP